MSEIKINIKKLQSESKKATERLQKFIEKRMEIKAKLTGADLILTFENENPRSKREIKDNVKKFLHKENLDKDLRVLVSDSGLSISDRK
ncbi:MAG: hypothetical protein ABIH76_06270 [Candidatus Bathyarchaeota archaeon]